MQAMDPVTLKDSERSSLVADVEGNVQKGRPVGMSGHLQPLYRCQAGVCVPPQLQSASAEPHSRLACSGFAKDTAVTQPELSLCKAALQNQESHSH